MSFIVECAVFVIAAVCFFLYRENKKHGGKGGEVQAPSVPFLRKYLVMYVLAVSADWIQGPYIYDLYTVLGLSWSRITTLYMCSFLSSAISGTFLGALSDSLGHRLSALAYCLLYAVSSLLKTSHSMGCQVFSSILGGISCTLLYTVFDSWLVAEHKRTGNDSALTRSFSLESACSSIAAIVAGIVGSILTERSGGLGLGQRAPFVAAAIILLPCAICVLRTIPPKSASPASPAAAKESTIQLVRRAWDYLLNSRKARLVCATQALFEGAMYIFVVLWTPIIRGNCPSTREYLSTLGWIFSAFMVAMTTGSQIYAFLTSKHFNRFEIALGSFAVASLALYLPTLVKLSDFGCVDAGLSTYTVFFSFMTFECVCGMYYPIINDYKASFFPSEFRTGLMSIARVGQNIFICSVLLSADWISNGFMLFLACLALSVGSIIQMSMMEDDGEVVATKAHVSMVVVNDDDIIQEESSGKDEEVIVEEERTSD